MKVATHIRDDGACGYYRIGLPTRKMAEFTDAHILAIPTYAPLQFIREAVEADVFLIARCSDEDDYELIKTLQDLGKKVVSDYDDNLFAVSPMSGHYGDFGIEEVKVQMRDGSIKDVWIDGQHGFDIKRNKARMYWRSKCIEQLDAVFTTTEILADVYRKLNPNVYVLPNSLDLSVWKDVPIKRDNPDEIRLYWSGGSSHYEDVIILKEVLPIIMERYPQTKLVMLGMHFSGATRDLPQKRFELHEWVPTPAYPYKTVLLDADISLIPLTENEFSRCKSNIKWVEQGALLVPSVTSLVSPYKEWYNGTNGVFVEQNTRQGWIDGISYLIENPIERWKMGAAARTTVAQNFDININCFQWYKAFEEILNG